jgi:hypothetical protein
MRLFLKAVVVLFLGILTSVSYCGGMKLTVCQGDPRDIINCNGPNCQEYFLHDRQCYVDTEKHSWLFSCMWFPRCFGYAMLRGNCSGRISQRGIQACDFCADRSIVACNKSSISQMVQCNDECKSCVNLYTASLGQCTEVKEDGEKSGLHVDATYSDCKLVLVQSSNESDCSFLSSSIQQNGLCFSSPANPFMSFQIQCFDHDTATLAPLPIAPPHVVAALGIAFRGNGSTREGI